MDAFLNVLIKMSLRGTVIILIVLCVRFLLKKLRVSHKYIIGLWAMVFLYFIIPWKLSLPVGFWNNEIMPEEVRVIIEDPATGHVEGAADNTVNIAGNPGVADDTVYIVDNPGAADDAIIGMPGTLTDDDGAIVTTPVEPTEQDIKGAKEAKQDSPGKPAAGKMLNLLWLAGLVFLSGHMLYSYIAIKRKLLLSVLYQDEIWWAEDIDIPMAFGLVCPQIYLPISMEFEDLDYVVAHERMHIHRKDGLFKMLAYVVCLFHWFNPFIWIAYSLLGSDMEKACDEEVIRSMGEERRKEYAYALLHMAAENGMRKKRVFVAPICFDEGNVKSRIRNIMKYKYTLPWIGSASVVLIAAMSVVFLTEAKDAGQEGPERDRTEMEGQGGLREQGEGTADRNSLEDDGVNLTDGGEGLPAFYVADLDALQIGKSFSLEDYYITSRYTASNYYHIDEDGVLWGSGSNEFGQLGTGTYGEEEYYNEPVKIAEHVLSVDASWNDYFCIYLTEDGVLYGVGLNYADLLIDRRSQSRIYSAYDYDRVTTPVRLMTDVSYARAGLECIVALKTDRSAYWWGRYAPVTHTYADGGLQYLDDYWKVEKDPSNPVIEPIKIMEHCRYITTGAFTGAAISESGELYTWGFNVFGQCGTPVTDSDFVRTPVKVMDGVKMVWVDRIVFNDSPSQSQGYTTWETNYNYNTFVLTEDDTLLAAGVDLGDKEKVTQVNGDLVESQTHRYSDSFVPVRAVGYSIDSMLKTLSKLDFGMSIEEVEEILSGADLRAFRVVGESVSSEGYKTCVSALYNQYHCYFDSDDMLARITIQEGGSRDGCFKLGMSFADLEEVVREAGGSFIAAETEALSSACWVYQDESKQIQYKFYIYEGHLSVVHETAMSEG